MKKSSKVLLIAGLLCLFLNSGCGNKEKTNVETSLNLVEQRIDHLLSEYESGKISRKEFIGTIANGSDTSAGDLQAVTLDHVTIRAKNLEKSSKFYQEVFGMPLKRIIPGQTHYLSLGNSFLGIESLKDSVCIDHICLGLKNFDSEKIIARLNSMGIKPDGDAGKTSLKFRDPDGILIQLSTIDYALTQARDQK
jgi:catechol 2,3-dioxygenase-like lactoylglutathione lyase family enzyme